MCPQSLTLSYILKIALMLLTTVAPHKNERCFKMAKVYVTKDLILICKENASCPAIEGKARKREGKRAALCIREAK